MGNTRSEFFEPVAVDLWWNNDQSNRTQTQVDADHRLSKRKSNEDKMEEVRKEVSTLHQKRIKLIGEKKKEMAGLREEVARQKTENEELVRLLRQNGIEAPNNISKASASDQTDNFEVPGSDPDLEIKIEEPEPELSKTQAIEQQNLELQINISDLQKKLQGVNSELAAFESEREEYKTHVTALKDIITVSKQLLLMREKQIKELGQKVTEIEESLAEKELKAPSIGLREEYERQLHNIKQLRVLYDERQRIDKTERRKLKDELDDAKSSLITQETKNSELQTRVDELEEDNSKKYDSIVSLESQLGFTKAECAELRAEMSAINQLFSQIISGFNNGQEVDLDKLIKSLEENHALLTNIVINEESNALSYALPKVLLDLVSQVNEKTNLPEESTESRTLSTIVEESESQTSSQQNSLSSASEIVQNLPKVWKVLAELLSHQTAPVSVLNENNDEGDNNPCYKSVQTPSGPALVLSVSKTYIRLKDLILEKKSLEKETTQLKHLNTHLETRLQDQEKRLEMVSHELSKTWNVVGKMQKQHQQLHTQEKILRYELAQKRKLLNELKVELEYCREKWIQAREKNSTTEEQWKQLRTEFASRKKTISEDLNNSVESGYSDERSSSDDDVEAEFEESSHSEPGTSSSKDTESNVSKVDVVEELQDTSDEHVLNTEGNEQTIFEVIQDEIASIEGSASCSEEILTSDQKEVEDGSVILASNEDIQQIPKCSEDVQSLNDELAIGIVSSSCTDNQNNLPTQEEPLQPQDNIIISNPTFVNRSSPDDTIEKHTVQNKNVGTKETVKTDVVQNITKKVQKDEAVGEEKSSMSEIKLDKGDTDVRRRDIDDMYKKLEEDILQTIRKTQNGEPSTSKQNRTAEEILMAREERLKCLEEQSNQLLLQATKTSNKSVEMSSKLDSLHEHYADSCNSNQNQTEILDHNLQKENNTVSDHNLQEENTTISEEPSTSTRTPEEILARREERLQIMEEQAQQLVKKALRNSLRGVQFCSKLTSLHDRYGESSDSSDDAVADDDNNNNNSTNNTETAVGQSENVCLDNEEHEKEETLETTEDNSHGS